MMVLGFSNTALAMLRIINTNRVLSAVYSQSKNQHSDAEHRVARPRKKIFVGRTFADAVAEAAKAAGTAGRSERGVRAVAIGAIARARQLAGRSGRLADLQKPHQPHR